MKKRKKYGCIVVLLFLIGAVILYCSSTKIEKSGMDGIYFGMPGFLIEWKEGKPDEKKKMEYGVVRTYENIDILGHTGKITYCSTVGLTDIQVLYNDADEALYQEIYQKLFENYKGRKDFFGEDEIKEGTSSSVTFGTNHGATGITVEITLEHNRLRVSMNSLY